LLRDPAVALPGVVTNARRAEPSLDEKVAAHRLAWAKTADLPRTSHQVVHGDARELPRILAGRSVHLVVTSPPYWNLKRYPEARGGAQLGNLDDREQFLGNLDRVWRACFDALVPGGRMCVVVGDVCRARRKHGRHVVEPLHAHLLLRCQALGFDPLAPMIWSKIANMTTEVAGPNAFLGKPYEPNAIVKNDIEYILMFRKPGGYRHPTAQQRALSLIAKTDFRRWFQQVWTDIPGENQRRKHPAPFPVEIARRLIGMFSCVEDTVLDPFWGTGTTSVAAWSMYRSSVGVEIEPRYVALGRRRLQEAAGAVLFEQVQ
jgi:site-specific DNA-methyltransferase (adenine-specific)